MSGICELKLSMAERATNDCTKAKCETCVWNSEERPRREELMRTKGLTKCADGFKRLIITRPEEKENGNA